MKLSYYFAILILGTTLSCTQKKPSESTGSKIELKVDKEEGTIVIQKLDSLKSNKDAQVKTLQILASKKDSIQKLLSQLETSLADIESKKINPGISGVNEKLNELKGQKENLDEQLNLQKKEIELANKKLLLLDEEKSVYDSQKQVLWDKGAAPEEFKEIDSLLSEINKKIADEKLRLKNLNRNISDIEEQIVSINKQRNFLSTKIRENYNAKQIFEEYSKEEKENLTNELSKIETQINAILNQSSELDSEISKINQENQNIATQKQALQKEIEYKQSIEKAQQEAAKKSRVRNTFIGILLIGILLVIFYFIGKKKKNTKSSKKTKNSKK